jgi:proteasome accessory factor B
MATKVDKSERLFNLTCALLYSTVGLTKQEILSRVQGYKEDYKFGGDNSNLDRQFERDKTELTRTGVHWQVENPISAMEDNQEFRYRIKNEAFNWPKDVQLSAEQIALLNLAADVWSKTSLSADANQGIMRIRALGESPAGSDMLGVAPTIRTHAPSFQRLTWALEGKNVVEFEYRKAGEETSQTRTVQPWALESIDGQWLLLAWDELRQEPRNFLLKRIISQVKHLNRTFEAPKPEDLSAMRQDLVEHTTRQQAEIRVKPGTLAWLHFQMNEPGTADSDRLTIHYMDLQLLAEDLLEFVLDLEVIRPAELKDLIQASLEKVASEHHG